MATKMTREEAINKVRQMNLPKETMEILQALAPELAESEDERIRKWLVDYFKEVGKSWIHRDISPERIVTYLEKQKEQKPEEKPINWTELTWEDINYLEDLMAKVHYEFRNGIGAESFGKEVLEKFREYKEDEYTDEKEQKSAEWGEDEEFGTILNLVYKAIRKVLASFGVYSEDEELLDSREESIDYYSQRCAEEILKSLRPSWKPSEEQMEALNEIVNILAASPFLHQNDYLFNILNGLREELKKLL